MMDFELILKLMFVGVIEVVLLVYMWGRILNDVFIVLDEVQNIMVEQMKMFFICLGFGFKVVVIGDVIQIDLLGGVWLGLWVVVDIFEDIDDIYIVELISVDVVCYCLVLEIVDVYVWYEEFGLGLNWVVWWVFGVCGC